MTAKNKTRREAFEKLERDIRRALYTANKALANSGGGGGDPLVSGSVSGDTMSLVLDSGAIINVDVTSLNQDTYVTSGSVINGSTLRLVFNDASTVDINLFTLKLESMINFTARFQFSTGNPWITANTSFGYYGTSSHNVNVGTGATPVITDGRTLGLGYFPVGTILHRIEFGGHFADNEVENVELYFMIFGEDLNTTGYNRASIPFQQQINLGTDTIDFPEVSAGIGGDTFSFNTFDLEDFEIVTESRMLTFAARSIGTLTGNRFWYTNAKLYYTLP